MKDDTDGGAGEEEMQASARCEDVMPEADSAHQRETSSQAFLNRFGSLLQASDDIFTITRMDAERNAVVMEYVSPAVRGRAARGVGEKHGGADVRSLPRACMRASLRHRAACGACKRSLGRCLTCWAGCRKSLRGARPSAASIPPHLFAAPPHTRRRAPAALLTRVCSGATRA